MPDNEEGDKRKARRKTRRGYVDGRVRDRTEGKRMWDRVVVPGDFDC